MTKRTLFDSSLARIRRLLAYLIVTIALFSICSSAWAVRDSCYGASETEDCAARSAAAANNYGGSTTITGDQTTTTKLLFRPLNVATKLGANATVNACTLYIYVGTPNNGKTIIAHRVFKPWAEGTANAADPGANPGATWTCWDADSDDSSGWGTTGCENVNDAGSDNSSKGSGFDRKSTAEGSVMMTTTAGYYKVPISAGLVQAWYDGTAVTNGVALSTAGGSGAWFVNASENASNKPYFVFEYSVSTGSISIPSAIYKQGKSGAIYTQGISGKR